MKSHGIIMSDVQKCDIQKKNCEDEKQDNVTSY